MTLENDITRSFTICRIMSNGNKLHSQRLLLGIVRSYAFLARSLESPYYLKQARLTLKRIKQL
jgi:hypothetical protein